MVHVTSYLSLVLMESKKHEELCKALDMVVASYKSNLKVVRVLSSDSESELNSDAINLYIKRCRCTFLRSMRRLLRDI